MAKVSRIEIAKEYLNFSAAHFTIFSATERERLHGHNFAVGLVMYAGVGDEGLSLDYNIVKRQLKALCLELDEYLLLPVESPFLQIDQQGENFRVAYNDETMTFLCSDTRLLPVANITIESLSAYLLDRLLQESRYFEDHDIRELELKVSSGPGQWGSTHWIRDE